MSKTRPVADGDPYRKTQIFGIQTSAGSVSQRSRDSDYLTCGSSRQDHPAHRMENAMSDEQPYMLLTGASRGIGHATVKLFQARGWRTLTVSRQAFSEECAWPSARESHIQADLARLDQIEHLAEIVRKRLPNGKLHALVNNAGISP